MTNLDNCYQGMISRCTRPYSNQYKDYGGRGIKVCAEWSARFVGIAAFRAWALANGYEEGLQLDRRQVNGDYTPENCQWVTRSKNQRNRRDSVTAEYEGETWNVHDLHDAHGVAAISVATVISRLKAGWDTKRALTEPARWKTRPKEDENLVECWGESRRLVEHATDERCVVGLDTVYKRLKRGLTAEQALTLPKSARV